MKVVSREYKVMLDHQAFAARKEAAELFWKELTDLGKTIAFKGKGCFDSTKKREVLFLDTPDVTLRRNGLVLRVRENREEESLQYTLKCRSPDRYLAAGVDLSPAEDLDCNDDHCNDDHCKEKLEEDIAAPFRSRFSHSTTLTFADGNKPRFGKMPKSLCQAAELFPVLTDLRLDGFNCPGDTKLVAVNGVRAFERVLTGPSIEFDSEDAEVALILWSSSRKGRPLVAEFSFRYKDKKEDFSRAVAKAAKDFYGVLQRHDWCHPTAISSAS